ncbi:helix-turn-helix domain-containing protein [Spirillospora sp. CA-294931]|uniref:helix-turn-helix domain-containing protein n=1 Tax=Spirillospora sp. CA-294931 TaxID=3240042 RepID=UPI003D92D084
MERLSGASETADWEAFISGPRLGGLVVEYGNYRERASRPVVRREVARPEVVVVFELDDPLTVAGREFVSFASGIVAGATKTAHGGRQVCVEVRLTPLGAYRLFGVPMESLTGQAVDLELLWPRAREVRERLAAAVSSQDRFALLDRELGRALDRGPEPDRVVEHVWRELVRTRGDVSLGALVQESGADRGRLAKRFRVQVGATPKAAAKAMRFHRAVELLARDGDLASIAAVCGYYDQAHLNRDFRVLAGCSPTRLLGARLHDLPGTAWES